MPATKHVHNLPHQKASRRQLRSNLTQAEALLWRALQRSQLAGRKFRRQHGIGPYIVDFYCAAEKLVIELDGAGHFTVSGEAYDVERTAYLTGLGLRVLRFENRLVLEQTDGVLAGIEAAFGAGDCRSGVSTTPSPSSSEEGN
ncbi:Very-short-patch-repair endonuclease [Hymenobacter daecheongensis DSM 21074]|uniref:Very-short-patch-repair endonuclease n=1 Tax=Hymenobacter daecheongensis DSM 21074 TaxID=1121955 RepID=A0A1M6ASN9_9BACT|nr:endonuclease domain-containing protein [Hymenobacter daecheongensis]SHI39243.1 Very-short-patch-repair endonuclease [Hymenobacter daecheongensis DSM 21074]